MFDFLDVAKEMKKGVIYIYPAFIVCQSKDLMIRGGDFYAIWNETTGLWSSSEFDAITLIDNELKRYFEENKDAFDGCKVSVQYLRNSRSGSIDSWNRFVKCQMPDNYHHLDEKLIFSDTKTTRRDYASKRLPYPLIRCETPAYDELMDTLYSPEERRKLEWAIGSVISGDSKKIQKFVVLYGSAGTGKSTVLNIIQDLFEGYWAAFDSKSLGSKNDSFALEPFSDNPLVGIQHDGDLSHIEDNTRLNSLVSHETMSVNAKFKSLYSMKFNAFLFMGTNRPVKITDAKSGLLRRLIDISPTGSKIPSNRYNQLVEQIQFELGGIACRCLDIYKENPKYYNNYTPESMLSASNSFYNFVLDNYDIFEKEEVVTLSRAWTMYKEYSADANLSFPMSKIVFKEELKNYFDHYDDRKMIDGVAYRSIYTGFKKTLLLHGPNPENNTASRFKFVEQHSLLDGMLADCKAQYAKEDETPCYSWDNVKTELEDIDTSKLHYVRVPTNHIVIDFDLKTADGKKSFKKNLEAANKWPKTYAELSKSGEGIHLHYIYDGDVKKLCRLYDEDIEIKVFTGKSSLRRKVTKCNDIPVATISSGLPLKEEVKVVSHVAIKDQKELMRRIKKCLNKEYIDIPSTASNVSFIKKMLDDAYASGMHYDITALRPAIMTFATNSTHQSEKCMKMVLDMKFCSEETSEFVDSATDQLIFYDVEVFPNLFVVVWKAPDKQPVKMINPTPEEINDLTQFRLVGFNCRRYDNHILYARILGYSNADLYKVSQNIINKSPNAFFKEAYNLSYTDIYDFCSKKQSLKKWEIELGIHHQELGLPWDQPVPEELWTTVADYCINDVVATEAVFNARKGDWLARQILADVAGGSVNDTTNSLTTKIIFGKERHPKLVYTDLATGEQY